LWLEVERVISPFRASGRYIWLACHVLMAGTLAFVLRSFGRVSGLTLLIACLILQVGDSWKLIGARAREAVRSRAEAATL
jgi:hypothetical protein